MLEVPGFSKELCGGTHVRNTGAVGLFRILSDRALAAGVRRIEAVAGAAALELVRTDRERLLALELELKAPADRLLERVHALKEQLRESRQKKAAAAPDAATLLTELEGRGGLVWKHFPGLEPDALRALGDALKGKALPPVLLLTGGDADSVPFLFLCARGAPAKAGDLAKAFGKRVGGGGGGRPDFAQGQGTLGQDLEAAVAALRQEAGLTQA